MDVRSQIATVFHLDKCIGCHTCSVACKNQWTDRRGLEYAWWNNVETKPGAGYPVRWEDQERRGGGWKASGGRLELRQGGALATLGRLFHNPRLPVLDDYYEPFTYRYGDLFDAPAGEDQPTGAPSTSRPGRTGTTTSAGRTSGPRGTRGSTRSTRPTGATSWSSSGWPSSTCRGSATTA